MNIQKVLIVEDESLYREYLLQWFERAGYGVVGAVGDLRGAERMSETRVVDLVVLDMDLPDGEGWEYIDRQMERDPGTRILVLTAYVGGYPVMRLKRQHGVMGILDKGKTDGAELGKAVEAVGSWRSYYTERVERTSQEILRESGGYYRMLSPREEELVRFFAIGLSNGEIGTILGLKESTVQGHRRNVMGKVGVGSTPDLMVWAVKQGFVTERQLIRRAVG